MKKTFSLTLLTLFLMFFSFVIFPVKVFASEWITAEDWYNHISQFDYGFAKGEIGDEGYNEVYILIVEEPAHEYEGCWIIYYYYEVRNYFGPELGTELYPLLLDGDGILWYLEQYYEDFDGYFYWNFEEKYWQIEYYATSEIDYYIQRIDELENEIQDLEDEIQDLVNQIQDLENENGLLENQIQDLENEISLLENEIQDLEDEIEVLENEKG